MSICFLPKSRASIDQAPGPIIAKVTPSATSMMHTQASVGCDIRMITSTTATTIPATGVHKPNSSSNPAMAPMICGTKVAVGGVFSICAIAERKRTTAVRSL